MLVLHGHKSNRHVRVTKEKSFFHCVEIKELPFFRLSGCVHRIVAMVSIIWVNHQFCKRASEWSVSNISIYLVNYSIAMTVSDHITINYKYIISDDDILKSIAWEIKPALTHWGRATHICIVKLTIIGSDNGLSPWRHQAIIWSNAGILLIGLLSTNFSEFLIAIHTFSFNKMHLKMSSAK